MPVSGIGECWRIAGIECYCSLKQTSRTRKSRIIESIERLHCLQDKIIRGHVLRMLAQRFFQFAVAHIRRNRLDYALGNAVLKVEQIIELALVLVGVDYFAR